MSTNSPGGSSSAHRLLAPRLDGLRAAVDAVVPPQLEAGPLVQAIVDALGTCSTDGRIHVHSGAEAIFDDHLRDLSELDPEVIDRVRAAFRREALAAAGTDAGVAVAALHCLAGVFDQLLVYAAHRRALHLEQLAFVDELTGLGNRRGAQAVLHANVATAHRHDRELTVVAVDVDHLKWVNDTQGHDAGDAALRSLAEAFRESLRGADAAFRTGGDEFLLVCPETTRSEVDRLLTRVAAVAPAFSYGTASASEAESAEELWQLADQRMLDGRAERRAAPNRGVPVSQPAAPSWGDVGRAAFVGLVAYCVLALRVPLPPVAAAVALGAGAAMATSRTARASATALGPLVCGGAVTVAVALVVMATRQDVRPPEVTGPAALGAPVPPLVRDGGSGNTERLGGFAVALPDATAPQAPIRVPARIELTSSVPAPSAPAAEAAPPPPSTTAPVPGDEQPSATTPRSKVPRSVDPGESERIRPASRRKAPKASKASKARREDNGRRDRGASGNRRHGPRVDAGGSYRLPTQAPWDRGLT